MIDFKNLLPQFCTKSWVEEYGVTAIEFTEDVAIGFVSKVDSGYSYLLNYMY